MGCAPRGGNSSSTDQTLVSFLPQRVLSDEQIRNGENDDQAKAKKATKARREIADE